MTWDWKKLFSGIVPASRTSRAGTSGLPSTFEAGEVSDDRIVQPKLFDPALKHFGKGFRRGEPSFSDEALARRWRIARRQAMHHILRVVHNSPWQGNLVLRGSAVMRAWFGDRVREPGDIDWTVVPSSIRVSDPWTAELSQGLVSLLAPSPSCHGELGVEFIPSAVAIDDIWTYERAPGRRMVFPWQAGDLPGGAVQCDIVFGEELPLPAEPTTIPDPDADRPGITVPTAGMELSLAWKLMWLETDSYPQGKDLYDAVLLAENTPVSRELLQRLLNSVSGYHQHTLEPDFPLAWQVEWDDFQREYPWVQGTAKEWQERLAHSLAPSFRHQEDGADSCP